MKTTINRLLLLCFLGAAVTSCKKDPVQPLAAKMPYLISTVQPTSYGRDSFAYKYTGNFLTGMDYYFSGTIGGFYQYRYQLDSNIVWWSWNTGTNEQQYSYLLLRDSSDKVTSLTWTVPVAPAYNFKQYKTVFKYNGSKLSKVFYLEDANGTGDLDTTSVYLATYTGDDITGIVRNNYNAGATGSQLETYTYTYDGAKNAFAAVNKNYWLLGYNYKNTETFDMPDAIISLSVHNITSETANGSTKTYTYTKDASGNIIASSGGGRFYLGYR